MITAHSIFQLFNQTSQTALRGTESDEMRAMLPLSSIPWFFCPIPCPWFCRQTASNAALARFLEGSHKIHIYQKTIGIEISELQIVFITLKIVKLEWFEKRKRKPTYKRHVNLNSIVHSGLLTFHCPTSPPYTISLSSFESSVRQWNCWDNVLFLYSLCNIYYQLLHSFCNYVIII